MEHKLPLRLDIRPDPDLVTVIDRWRAKQPDVPPRAEAVRRMIKMVASDTNKRNAENVR